MKKITFTLIIVILMACSSESNCNVNSSLITQYAAEITTINAKIDAATSQSVIAAFESQITALETKIEVEANKCN